MVDVATHYVHFFIPSDSLGVNGWIAPREDEAGRGGADATLVVPLNSKGLPFDGYWAFVVTVDEGRPILLDEPFEVNLDDGELVMRTPGADIRFAVELHTVGPYVGNLVHPDFECQFCAISPIKDAAYELLFDDKKAVIIGVLPDEYREA